jgi:cytochrome c-type biogenesis protein CcmE
MARIFDTILGRGVVLATVVALLCACGHASQSVAPSALAADPSTYDGQDVTVTGTVKNTGTRQTRRGTATTYQLCDTACINVIQFSGSSVSEGTQSTASGRFRASFGHRQMLTNVLIVGGRMGTQQ